jgi:3-methylcrotonyl-CoA carboxylase alpha subunit
MIDTILIANRGEIACRIMATARSMGLRCVAVYSDADAGARHVAMADEAIPIGGPAPVDSYLRGDAIIAAAHATGAQAIHPGYGFLSENPDFVEAVEQAGLTFVGPSAKAIRAMGLKDAAKALMEKAGVPVVPGYHGADQSDEVLRTAAEEIGYPVLIKAVAGGGGKGMRLVEQPKDFADALASARGEAQTAFGNPDVLVEKFVEKPRHIEVQVFGDGEKAVHLFERDCSLQRRHQKVIEEAPAPGMTEEMRQAMGQAAVRAAEAIGYKGAGTVEFIVDGSDGLRADGFWFMEMNTRLQVEHPVTEAITGVDLVEWQIRVASGEALPLAQEELTITGHAFEARLYAEDVPKGFLPATGQLTALEFPHDLRADTGVRPGDVISPHYDPMIAKIITHGPTRDIALARLARGVRGTKVSGTVTNLAFLGALAVHEGFQRGDVDTGLIGRDIDDLAAAPTLGNSMLAWAGLVALGLDQAPGPLTGFTLWGGMGRMVSLLVDGEQQDLRVQTTDRDHHLIYLPNGIVVEALFETGPQGQSGQWTLDGDPAPEFQIDGNRITLFTDYGLTVTRIDPLDRAVAAGAGGNLIEAPMPGLVKLLVAEAGQKVSAGDRLAVLEAMKMEHALTAPRDGTVAEVFCAQGDQVEAGAPLIQLEEEEEA